MNRQVNGNLWTARKIESTYILSIKSQASIVDALTDFMLGQNIRSAIISGIGILTEVILDFVDPVTKKRIEGRFEGLMEASEISGYISETQGSRMLFLNATLKNEHTLLAGQILDAKTLEETEIFLHAPGTEIIRFANEDLSVN
ncbi:PCC domain-containing protein [Chryseobacterium gossypii]|uniref:PCC domain-containing protein n=1 Tax=Chryseobacterium gossypii TaxID=3231602 RepID=UPI003525BA3C